MIRTSVPAGDSNGVLAPPSISDFFELYGNPSINMRKRTDYEGGVAYVTFEAKDPAQQSDLDVWASQIDADSEAKIRGRIGAAAVEDEARVSRDGGKRKIYAMPAREIHAD